MGTVIPALTIVQSDPGLPYVRPVVGAFTFKNAWVISTVYSVYDVITSGGSVWTALTPNVGVTPGTRSDVWGLMVPSSAGVSSVGLTAPAIFSVSGTPVTSSGSLALSLATQSAAQVFAGPATGSAAAPTFRALAATDIPSLPASQITTGLLALARGGTNADLSATGGASRVLKQVSTGAAITVAQLAFSDLSGSVAASQLPNPSASTLGGVESIAAVTSKWINAISTSGVPSATQPSITDLAVGTSANLASILSDETGTGSAVFATSPALVTPSIGIAAAQRLIVSQGTALTTGKVGSLTGFGSTASVSSVVGKDGLFVVNISCSGTGQATNASFVLTFADAAYALAPIAICCRGDGNAPSGAFIFATTTTTIQVAIAGTPVAGNIYSFQVFVPGR
jgi:hypothetical protein